EVALVGDLAGVDGGRLAEEERPPDAHAGAGASAQRRERRREPAPQPGLGEDGRAIGPLAEARRGAAGGEVREEEQPDLGAALTGDGRVLDQGRERRDA